MKYLKEISLLVIAVVLTANFILSYIWPSLYLNVHYAEYYDSIATCAKAKASFREAKNAPSDLNPSFKHRLLLTSEVELANCHEQEVLRAQLLANGVGEADLKLVELKALEAAEVPLKTFVEQYGMGRE